MHIIVIPARMNSQGFKFKNRKFFPHTVDFLKNVEWFQRIIVSTDDPVLVEKAKKQKYEIHKRPEKLAGPAVSIKAVFSSVINDMEMKDDDIVWLNFLPLLYKNKNDLNKSGFDLVL